MVVRRAYSPPSPENNVANSASSGGSGNLSRNSGVHIPNYHGVNQALFEQGDKGEISFMSSLAHESKQALEHQQRVYDNLEVNNAVSELNNTMIANSKSWKCDPNNASGRGYQEYIVSQHKALSKQYIEGASNPAVKNALYNTFVLAAKDYANKAFQEENEMFTSYSYENTTELMQRDLINIVANPDMTESYGKQYLDKIATLKCILPDHQYSKLESEAIQNFVYSNGIGWINKNPHQAKKLFEGDYYKNNLSADNYTKLLHVADTRIKENDDLKIKTEKMISRSDSDLANANYSDYNIVILSGAGKQSEIEALYECGAFGRDPYKSKERKNKLLAKLMQYEGKTIEKDSKFRVLQESVDNNANISLQEIPISIRKEYMHNSFKTINDERSGKGVEPLKYSEKIAWIKDRAAVFNYKDHDLQSAISSQIKYSKNPKEIVDATNAVLLANPLNIIDGIGDDIENFSRYAYGTIKSGNVNNIVDIRDRWFNQDPAIMDRRKKEFEESSDAEDFFVEGSNSFYREYGLNNTDSLFWEIYQSDDKIVRDQIDTKTFNVMKKTYIRTGDIATAKAVAASYIEEYFVETDIDGIKQRTMNPPTKKNIGLEDFVIKNIVADSCDKAIRILNDAKVPIRNASGESFLNVIKNRKELLEKPCTKSFELEVYVKISPSETEKRSLNIEAINNVDKKYNVYYLRDKSDPSSKVYLINPNTASRFVIDFDAFLKGMHKKQ